MSHLATITVSSHKRDITVHLIRVRFTMPTLGIVRPLNTFSKETATGVYVLYLLTMRAAAGIRLNRRGNSDYDQETPQSQTADKPGAP